MKRILFFVFCAFPVLQPQAHGAVEIYANGHKYPSMQMYLASEKSALARSSVELAKVKTFQVNTSPMSDTTRHKLYVLSVENGVVDALRDFYQPQGQFHSQLTRRIPAEELQEAIQQAVTASKDPKFLISGPGKVRIMSMTTQDSGK